MPSLPIEWDVSCDAVHAPRNGHGAVRHGRPGHEYESSSMISSDLESTSFVDSEEDASSRITTTTGESESRLNSVNHEIDGTHSFNEAVLTKTEGYLI